MAYPEATPADVAFFREHGWIVVEDAIDPADLTELVRRCDEILAHRDTMAFDWAWEKGTPREQRAFRIVQASPTRYWPDLNDSPFRKWAIEYGAALMGSDLEFWYDQFLAKPPGASSPTYWHQDEGYWGRNLDERGITCWMPFHDVDETNGCMHFIDGGHRLGILPHKQPENVQSDLLYCEPDERRAVACPLRLGSVTFHHGKTPHMTPANLGPDWRRILTQHLRTVGTRGEGDHYSWKIYVNQFTGETFVPDTR
ncbi:MAG: phytanoyl-CoA dioxygenase family protein [Pseudomonadales bacterium]|jgi:ectoine hydroxylase-related dioxygenase (phytanoyl-CoA dioxygenase family)